MVKQNKHEPTNKYKQTKQTKPAKPTATATKSTAVAKPQINHYVDFGPHINYMDNVSLNASQIMWKTWFAENVKDCKKE